MTTYTADKEAWWQVQTETHAYLRRIMRAQAQSRGNYGIVGLLAKQFCDGYDGLEMIANRLGLA